MCSRKQARLVVQEPPCLVMLWCVLFENGFSKWPWAPESFLGNFSEWQIFLGVNLKTEFSYITICSEELQNP